MLSTERRQRQRDELRENIIATAIQLASTGWGAVTMRAIADHLGYTAAGLYHHFASKDAVLEEINRRGHAMLLDRFMQVPDKDPRKKLLGMARALVDMAYDQPELYQAVAGIGVVCDRIGPPEEALRIKALVDNTVLPLLPSASMLPDASELLRAALSGIVTLCLNGQIAGGRKRARSLTALAVHQAVDSWGQKRHC